MLATLVAGRTSVLWRLLPLGGTEAEAANCQIWAERAELEDPPVVAPAV